MVGKSSTLLMTVGIVQRPLTAGNGDGAGAAAIAFDGGEKAPFLRRRQKLGPNRNYVEIKVTA